MSNGTFENPVSLRVHRSSDSAQGAFPETCVRRVYPGPRNPGNFHSKYVCARKVLKAPTKLDSSDLAFFCRLNPMSLWVRSLLAVAWGGALCQARND